MKRDEKILKYVGNKIRTIRNLVGISQEELGFRCSLDRTYISDVELGKRNISLINLNAIANALNVQLYEIVSDYKKRSNKPINEKDNFYIINSDFKIECGFAVSAKDIQFAAIMTSHQLEELPFALFQSINLKAISGMIGAIFALFLAERVGGIVNPIEKGHPDIIPESGKNAAEELLRNYPEGLEIKCTVGNVEKGSDLETGHKRLSRLTNITWQAHHREVERLMGLIIDFAGNIKEGNFFPAITGVFYSEDLNMEDWGKISGTTGRNTKVTGMTASGKRKMGQGWVLLINDKPYIDKYKKILSFI
jgi:transcriptional regulator with XRE-family HTH domain